MWQDRAACKGMDTNVFYPSRDEAGIKGQIAQARAICSRCPVIDLCLDYALAINACGGVWGGMTQEERTNVRRRKKLSALLTQEEAV